MLSKEVLARIRRIHLHARFLVRDAMLGEYQSSFKGQGMEFEEVREYMPGDDVRHIDWNVTARSGFPHIKKFREERELTVFIVVDMSASGSFGTFERFKRDIAAEIAAAIAYLAIQNNDKVGVVLFSDGVEKFVPPKKGRNHVLRVIRDILAFEPKGRGTNLAGVLEFLGRVVRRRAVIFLVSDFFAAGYEQPLSLLSRKHDLVAISVRDRMERELPPSGIFECEDPESGARVAIDMGSATVRKAFAERAEREETVLANLLRRAKVERISVRTEESYLGPLVAFFMRRSRKRVLKLVGVLFALSTMVLNAPKAWAEVTLKAELDPIKGTSAEVFRFKVEASANGKGRFVAPDVSAAVVDQGLRVVRVQEKQPQPRDSRTVQSWIYELSADAPGVYEIPPLEWRWNEERKQTSRISFDVISVVATPLAGGKPDKQDILDIKPLYFEKMPYRYLVAACAAAVIVLSALAWFAWKWSRKRRAKVIPERVIPAHERALAALAALQVPSMAGLTKEEAHDAAALFQWHLGMILRTYLEEKGVNNATDKTSEELRESLVTHPWFASMAGREYANEIRLYLQDADGIKFARNLPQEENLQQSKSFVEKLVRWCVERENSVQTHAGTSQGATP